MPLPAATSEPSVAYLAAALLALAFGVVVMATLVMVTLPVLLIAGAGWLVAGRRRAHGRRVETTSAGIARWLPLRPTRMRAAGAGRALLEPASTDR